MTHLLQQYVTNSAEQGEQDIAVVMGARKISYGALEKSSNQLARQLMQAGCQPGDRICLFAPKCPEAVVMMIAVLKADCIYVPIDMASPALRIRKIIQSCQPRFLLATKTAMGLLDELFEDTAQTIPVGSLAEKLVGKNFTSEFDQRDIRHCPDASVNSAGRGHLPAHILFTSGSTGQPKGVIITHANVRGFVNWAVEYFEIGRGDRVSNHSPLHFDLSTFDIYGALAAGCEVHLVPPEISLVPRKAAEFIRDSRLTQWFSVPSILTYMSKFDALTDQDFPDLKRVMWCGEVLPTPTLIYWMQKLPHVQFTNLYGPTEATIASSYYTVAECPADPREEVPIGHACGGERLIVLDRHNGQPAPPGEIGDLYIGGVGVSPGYWRDPQKTKAVFSRDPVNSEPNGRLYKTGDLARVGKDGLIYFVGREDTQVKSRGYRIELGEIETAFHSLPLLRDCAVIGVASAGFEGTVICCAYVPQPDKTVTPALLRKEASVCLPRYMLPSRWLELDMLPKNANGKTDRPKLKEMFEEHVVGCE
jgi:amino acid adenylation domain-containing protein